MTWQCRRCNETWNNGFYGNNLCPNCHGFVKQFFGGFFKILFAFGIPLALIVLILAFGFPSTYRWAFASVTSALDSRTFYLFGPEAYAESVATGRLNQYYTLKQARPVYQEIVDSDRLASLQSTDNLAKGQIVRLEAISRRGGDVWGAVEVYQNDTPVREYVLLPRSWEQAMASYDMDDTKSAYQTKYNSFVKKNFKLEAVSIKEETEKKYIEEHPDYFQVPDMTDTKVHYYTLKTNQANIQKAHAFFLDDTNIARVVLQTNPNYKRPELKLDQGK